MATIIVGGLILIVVGLLQFESRERALLDARLDELRAAGEPLRYEDHLPPQPPDEENAARIYEQAMVEVERILGPEAGTILSERLATWDAREEGSEAAVRELLDDLGPVRALLHRAADLPASRFARGADEDPLETSPGLLHFRNLAIPLYLDGEIGLLEGDAERFRQAIDALLRYATAIGDGRTILEYHLAIAVRSYAYRLIDRALSDRSFDAATWAATAGSVDRHHDPDSLVRHLRGERCFGLRLLDLTGEIASGGESGAGKLDPRTGLHWLRLRSYLESLDGIIDAARLPLDDPDRRRRATDRLRTELAASAGNTWTTQLLARVTGVGLLSNIIQVIEVHAEQAARHRTLVATLRLASEFEPDGELPGAPADLPLDPDTGKPVIFRATPGGFAIYATGPDGADDGGVHLGPEQRADLGWRYGPGPEPGGE